MMSSSAPPYPPSPALTLAAVAEPATRRDDLDGDNWPLTWAADGALYAAYGDGWGCRPLAPDTKRNTGLVRLVGRAEDGQGTEVTMPWFGGGAENPNFKGCGLLAAGGALYHFLRYQAAIPTRPTRQQRAAALIWSADLGRTWAGATYSADIHDIALFFDEPDHAFHSPTFLQAGRDYALAQDDYVYLYSPHEDHRRANDRLDLARVRREAIPERTVYAFFAGLDERGRPAWTPDIARRRPIFTWPGHVSCGDIVYHAAVGRYLLATCGGEEGGQSSLAFFDAPHPWGPWTTVGYVPHWGSGRDGDYRYDPRLPVSWLSDDGLAAVLVYSDRRPADKLNFQRVRFARVGS
ncbi:MAG: hypothetical protein ACTHMU_15265 [Thermomicrobiales bacterium]